MTTSRPNTEGKMNEYVRGGDESSSHRSLTEHEVRLALALLAEGVSKRAIARKLCVSPRTVGRVLEHPRARMD